MFLLYHPYEAMSSIFIKNSCIWEEKMKDYNIYLRKDGRWEGRIPKPSENGKRKYKSFFGPSKEAVRRMIDEFYREKTKDISLSFIL